MLPRMTDSPKAPALGRRELLQKSFLSICFLLGSGSLVACDDEAPFVHPLPKSTNLRAIGPLEPVTRELCVVLDPELELDLGEAAVGAEEIGAIRIENACDAPLRIATRMRVDSAMLAIDPPAPDVIEVGGSTSVEVTFSPSTRGAFEEIAFIDVSEPFVESYPITVLGSSR